MIKITSTVNLKKDLAALLKSKEKEKLSQVISALKEATPVDTGNARDSWRLDGSTIVNDAEYIDELNEGSSKQAPEYFIEKTLLLQRGVYPNGTIVRSK